VNLFVLKVKGSEIDHSGYINVILNMKITFTYLHTFQKEEIHDFSFLLIMKLKAYRMLIKLNIQIERALKIGLDAIGVILPRMSLRIDGINCLNNTD